MNIAPAGLPGVPALAPTPAPIAPAPASASADAPARDTLLALMEAGQLQAHRITQAGPLALASVPSPPALAVDRDLDATPQPETGMHWTSRVLVIVTPIALIGSISVVGLAASGASPIAAVWIPMGLTGIVGSVVGTALACFALNRANRDPLAQPVTLAETLPAWRDLLRGAALQPARPWHHDDTPEAQPFALWLEKLKGSADYRAPATFLATVRRVQTLIEHMDDPALRAEIFAIARASAESCADSVTVGLNAMEMSLTNWRASRGELSADALCQTGRAMFRMHSLEAWARQQHGMSAAETTNDEVEILLGYQIALREPLQLPVSAQQMRYAHGIEASEIEAATRHIRALEAHSLADARAEFEEQLAALTGALEPLEPLALHPAAGFLACHYTPWARHALRTHAARANEIRAAAENWQSRLDDALFAGTLNMNDAEYTRAANAAKFLHEHGAAYEAALSALYSHA